MADIYNNEQMFHQHQIKSSLYFVSAMKYKHDKTQ